MKIGNNPKNRINIVIIGIVLVYGLIVARLYYLQIYKGDYYKKASQNNRIRIRKIKAPRGKIYDRNGKILVTNVAGYQLVYLKGKKYNDKIISEMSEFLKIEKKEVIKKIKKGTIHRYTGENLLIDDIPEEKAHRMIEKISSFSYLDIVTYPKRKYINGKIASHILGYVKKITMKEWEKLKDEGYEKTDIIGKKGIEKQYDKILKGQDGYEYIEVNALNKIVKKIRNKNPILGKDIYLSIDLDLQKKITDFMDDRKGSFIALDVKTGEILTAVSSPEYDLNKIASKISSKEWAKILNDKNKPLQNRLISSSYPPGSIFKPITALAILEEGIPFEEEIYDNGYYKIGKWKWRNWKPYGDGNVAMEDAIIHSNNIYFYTMGDRIGRKKILEIAKKMGLGKKTDVDLPEEQTGILPSNDWKKEKLKEQWYRGDTINLSIGQGFLMITPMQAIQIYMIIANEGIGYKPHFLDRIANEKKISSIISNINKMNPEYYKKVKQSLRKVVTEGTAHQINLKNIKSAAKTGSAENPQYKKTHAWLAGYCPYDKPEIAFVSFFEGAGHGGEQAGPTVKK
ncbi:MAG: penicillin-binding protein 2, partial [Fusobacteriia bacterium 4572_132]